MLTSAQNPKVKYLASLKSKKNRRPDGKFFIEGLHIVAEALRAGMLERVIYSESALKTAEGKDLVGRLISSDIPIEEASEKVIRSLSDVETPQGIAASARPKVSDIGSLFEDDNPLIVVACGIQDPGNLGTIIRTADAAGASGAVITSGSVDPYNDKAVRASAGSIFHLNTVRFDDIIGLVSALKRRGVRVISTYPGAEKIYYDADFRKPTAVILGNEAQGLPADIEKLSDETVSIPIIGGAESLNAAVSGAVIIYEALRQRRHDAG